MCKGDGVQQGQERERHKRERREMELIPAAGGKVDGSTWEWGGVVHLAAH